MVNTPTLIESEPLSLTESHLSIEATRPSLPPSQSRSASSSAGRVLPSFQAMSSSPSAAAADAHGAPATAPGGTSGARTSTTRSEPRRPSTAPSIDSHDTLVHEFDTPVNSARDPKDADAPSSSDRREDLEKGKVGAIVGEPVEKPPLTDDGRVITVVDWEGPDDPAFPLLSAGGCSERALAVLTPNGDGSLCSKNWSNKRRMGATMIVASFTFLSPMSSTMIAPATGQIAEKFGVTSTVEISSFTSIFVAAYALGPLFLGPASELYGRVPVLQSANLIYLLFNLVCAFAKTPTQLLVFRFLAGLGGSAPLGIGAGVLGDLWRPEERGRAASMYSLGPLLGPAVGPIAGAWIAEKSRWEWVFWSTTILCVVIQGFGLVYLRETYSPQLLRDKASKIKNERGLPADSLEVQTIFEIKSGGSRKPVDVFRHSMVMPFRLFWSEHILQLLAVFAAFIYGLIYITTVTTTDIFTQVYGESVGIAGLNFISQGLGFLIWAQTQGRVLDVVYRKFKERYGGEGKPEYRLPMMAFAVTLLPLGLLLYGWGAENRLHWIVPNIGLGFIAAGMISAFQCINMYLIDAFTLHAASAVAAATCLRSLCGFGFPLFAPSMFKALGYGWGCTLLAVVGIVIGWPAVPILFFYGERIRASSKYAAKSKVNPNYS
ncbi:BZ3500_MvSof-1268-A1-R1_Chr7-1g09150 [Microbotryum saponariae]|uniref:BZ3500_MvSof-1268-A1-R1_Chr7-1g09150 protein n=1 Tax=Microbotryum saponariae TaxID=289078 RepID=A0A2X0L288_9BASI|nr:BZ3501_MvSof-1269-A2-R1_Chr7-1g08855 [Microbotryum saponariae]SDA02893.1 BZ3500_MvSof-1268-A1-R1_Chr7-1g09150 [Microbotryum saponariae]